MIKNLLKKWLGITNIEEIITLQHQHQKDIKVQEILDRVKKDYEKSGKEWPF